MININSITESNEYLDYFINLNEKEKSELIDVWIEKMNSNNHNNYELLTFFRITEHLGVDTTDNVLETINFLDDSIDELDSLIDWILDKYIPGNGRQENLLQEISSKIEECKYLSNFYKEKVIN
jgi:hypothetical protein